VTVRVGMAGWVFPDWRGTFYPVGLPQKNELAYAATRVTSIEINSTFRSVPSLKSWLTWRDATPDEFVFSVKAPHYITQVRKLRNVEEPLERFFGSGILELGQKLGPVMWQLPEGLLWDAALVEGFIAQLPAGIRYAMEARDASFDNPDYLGLLARYGVASVNGPAAGFRYLRVPGGSLDDAGLDALAATLDDGIDAYVYFVNGEKQFTPLNALALLERLS